MILSIRKDVNSKMQPASLTVTFYFHHNCQQQQARKSQSAWERHNAIHSFDFECPSSFVLRFFFFFFLLFFYCIYLFFVEQLKSSVRTTVIIFCDTLTCECLLLASDTTERLFCSNSALWSKWKSSNRPFHLLLCPILRDVIYLLFFVL